MDIEKMIEQFRTAADKWEAGHQIILTGELRVQDALRDAATALSTLQAENEEMQKQLNMFSEFLCYMTGGLLSKTNYTAQEMATAAEDYQQKVCGECDLRAENEKLRAELERVKKLYESEKEDFIDYACSGVPNLSPYCMNRRPDCVDERGWCRSEKCHGFSREHGQKEE